MVTQRYRLGYWAAQSFARAASLHGLTGRLSADDRDYTEVYPPEGPPRCGTHAETTLVHGAGR